MKWCICQTPENFTGQRENFNVCKFLKNHLEGQKDPRMEWKLWQKDLIQLVMCATTPLSGIGEKGMESIN